MLTSRLTTTLHSASRFAPVERLIVTIAGSSWGVRPTAMARANRTDPSSERPSTTLMTRIEPASTAVTRTSSNEKSRRPSWKAVCGWRSPSRRAIAPNSVRPPVHTTTPSPLPSRTTVPMNAHDARSSEDSGAITGSLRFSAA